MTTKLGLAPLTGKTINRRRFLQGASGAAIAGAAAVILPARAVRAQSPKVIRLADDAGANFEIRTKYYFEPFTKATGIEIQHYSGERSLAKLKAMLQTGNLEFDMSIDEGSNAFAAARAGFLAPLDLARLDMSRLIFPEWTAPETIAWQYYSGGIGYNVKTQNGPVPRTWPEVWDATKFPGRRGLLARPQDTLEAALLASGVRPSELYPIDLDRAYASLDKIKPDVKIWLDSMPKGIEYLQARELQYSYTTTARLQNAKRAGLPLEFIAEIPISAPSNLQIMKDSPNYDSCMELVKWILNNDDGGAVGYFTQMVGFGPTDSAVHGKLASDVVAKLPKRDNEQAAWMNARWWGDNLAAVAVRHKFWLTS